MPRATRMTPAPPWYRTAGGARLPRVVETARAGTKGWRDCAWQPSGLLLWLTLLAPGIALAQAGEGWKMVGHLGMMQLVIVDHERESEEALYDDAIATLCPPLSTCFLRFYTNPQNVEVTVPLPDEISNNTTAFYTLSTKHSRQIFRWSCRIENDPNNCY